MFVASCAPTAKQLGCVYLSQDQSSSLFIISPSLSSSLSLYISLSLSLYVCIYVCLSLSLDPSLSVRSSVRICDLTTGDQEPGNLRLSTGRIVSSNDHTQKVTMRIIIRVSCGLAGTSWWSSAGSHPQRHTLHESKPESSMPMAMPELIVFWHHVERWYAGAGAREKTLHSHNQGWALILSCVAWGYLPLWSDPWKCCLAIQQMAVANKPSGRARKARERGGTLKCKRQLPFPTLEMMKITTLCLVNSTCKGCW